MSYSIVQFDNTKLNFLPHAEEPFNIIGRLVPYYDGTEWKTCEELFDIPKEKIYPSELFDSSEYLNNPNKAAFLAMINEECVGSIFVCKRWNKNAYIDSITIDRAHRGNGVGKMLMDKAVSWGKENGLYGVSLETQDVNLLACRFYLKYGFKLGGVDNKVYSAGPYRDELALHFYLLPDERQE